MTKRGIATKLSTLVVLSVLLSSFALAVGVSSPYWEGNPLKIAPGETKIVNLGLQNMGAEDDDDVTLKAELTEGSEIASISKSEYFVKANTKSTRVLVEVSIPEETSIGSEYKVTVSFRTITPGGEGVVFGIGFDSDFDVLVISESTEPKKTITTSMIIGILAIILIIIAIVMITRKKRN